MIKYALVCENAHEFEGWFGSSADYDAQAAKGLLECPMCATKSVRKQIMAPTVTGTKAQARPEATPQMRQMMMQAMGEMRRHV